MSICCPVFKKKYKEGYARSKLTDNQKMVITTHSSAILGVIGVKSPEVSSRAITSISTEPLAKSINQTAITIKANISTITVLSPFLNGDLAKKAGISKLLIKSEIKGVGGPPLAYYNQFRKTNLKRKAATKTNSQPATIDITTIKKVTPPDMETSMSNVVNIVMTVAIHPFRTGTQGIILGIFSSIYTYFCFRPSKTQRITSV